MKMDTDQISTNNLSALVELDSEDHDLKEEWNNAIQLYAELKRLLDACQPDSDSLEVNTSMKLESGDLNAKPPKNQVRYKLKDKSKHFSKRISKARRSLMDVFRRVKSEKRLKMALKKLKKTKIDKVTTEDDKKQNFVENITNNAFDKEIILCLGDDDISIDKLRNDYLANRNIDAAMENCDLNKISSLGKNKVEDSQLPLLPNLKEPPGLEKNTNQISKSFENSRKSRSMEDLTNFETNQYSPNNSFNCPKTFDKNVEKCVLQLIYDCTSDTKGSIFQPWDSKTIAWNGNISENVQINNEVCVQTVTLDSMANGIIPKNEQVVYTGLGPYAIQSFDDDGSYARRPPQDSNEQVAYSQHEPYPQQEPHIQDPYSKQEPYNPKYRFEEDPYPMQLVSIEPYEPQQYTSAPQNPYSPYPQTNVQTYTEDPYELYEQQAILIKEPLKKDAECSCCNLCNCYSGKKNGSCPGKEASKDKISVDFMEPNAQYRRPSDGRPSASYQRPGDGRPSASYQRPGDGRPSASYQRPVEATLPVETTWEEVYMDPDGYKPQPEYREIVEVFPEYYGTVDQTTEPRSEMGCKSDAECHCCKFCACYKNEYNDVQTQVSVSKRKRTASAKSNEGLIYNDEYNEYNQPYDPDEGPVRRIPNQVKMRPTKTSSKRTSNGPRSNSPEGGMKDQNMSTADLKYGSDDEFPEYEPNKTSRDRDTKKLKNYGDQQLVVIGNKRGQSPYSQYSQEYDYNDESELAKSRSLVKSPSGVSTRRQTSDKLPPGLAERVLNKPGGKESAMPSAKAKPGAKQRTSPYSGNASSLKPTPSQTTAGGFTTSGKHSSLKQTIQSRSGLSVKSVENPYAQESRPPKKRSAPKKKQYQPDRQPRKPLWEPKGTVSSVRRTSNLQSKTSNKPGGFISSPRRSINRTPNEPLPFKEPKVLQQLQTQTDSTFLKPCECPKSGVPGSPRPCIPFIPAFPSPCLPSTCCSPFPNMRCVPSPCIPTLCPSFKFCCGAPINNYTSQNSNQQKPDSTDKGTSKTYIPVSNCSVEPEITCKTIFSKEGLLTTVCAWDAPNEFQNYKNRGKIDLGKYIKSKSDTNLFNKHNTSELEKELKCITYAIKDPLTNIKKKSKICFFDDKELLRVLSAGVQTENKPRRPKNGFNKLIKSKNEGWKKYDRNKLQVNVVRVHPEKKPLIEFNLKHPKKSKWETFEHKNECGLLLDKKPIFKFNKVTKNLFERHPMNVYDKNQYLQWKRYPGPNDPTSYSCTSKKSVQTQANIRINLKKNPNHIELSDLLADNSLPIKYVVFQNNQRLDLCDGISQKTNKGVIANNVQFSPPKVNFLPENRTITNFYDVQKNECTKMWPNSVQGKPNFNDIQKPNITSETIKNEMCEPIKSAPMSPKKKSSPTNKINRGVRCLVHRKDTGTSPIPAMVQSSDGKRPYSKVRTCGASNNIHTQNASTNVGKYKCCCKVQRSTAVDENCEKNNSRRIDRPDGCNCIKEASSECDKNCTEQPASSFNDQENSERLDQISKVLDILNNFKPKAIIEKEAITIAVSQLSRPNKSNSIEKKSNKENNNNVEDNTINVIPKKKCLETLLKREDHKDNTNQEKLAKTDVGTYIGSKITNKQLPLFNHNHTNQINLDKTNALNKETNTECKKLQFQKQHSAHGISKAKSLEKNEKKKNDNPGLMENVTQLFLRCFNQTSLPYVPDGNKFEQSNLTKVQQIMQGILNAAMLIGKSSPISSRKGRHSEQRKLLKLIKSDASRKSKSSNLSGSRFQSTSSKPTENQGNSCKETQVKNEEELNIHRSQPKINISKIEKPNESKQEVCEAAITVESYQRIINNNFETNETANVEKTMNQGFDQLCETDCKLKTLKDESKFSISSDEMILLRKSAENILKNKSIHPSCFSNKPSQNLIEYNPNRGAKQKYKILADYENQKNKLQDDFTNLLIRSEVLTDLKQSEIETHLDQVFKDKNCVEALCTESTKEEITVNQDKTTNLNTDEQVKSVNIGHQYLDKSKNNDKELDELQLARIQIRDSMSKKFKDKSVIDSKRWDPNLGLGLTGEKCKPLKEPSISLLTNDYSKTNDDTTKVIDTLLCFNDKKDDKSKLSCEDTITLKLDALENDPNSLQDDKGVHIKKQLSDINILNNIKLCNQTCGKQTQYKTSNVLDTSNKIKIKDKVVDEGDNFLKQIKAALDEYEQLEEKKRCFENQNQYEVNLDASFIHKNDDSINVSEQKNKMSDQANDNIVNTVITSTDCTDVPNLTETLDENIANKAVVNVIEECSEDKKECQAVKNASLNVEKSPDIELDNNEASNDSWKYVKKSEIEITIQQSLSENNLISEQNPKTESSGHEILLKDQDYCAPSVAKWQVTPSIESVLKKGPFEQARSQNKDAKLRRSKESKIMKKASKHKKDEQNNKKSQNKKQGKNKFIPIFESESCKNLSTSRIKDKPISKLSSKIATRKMKNPIFSNVDGLEIPSCSYGTDASRFSGNTRKAEGDSGQATMLTFPCFTTYDHAPQMNFLSKANIDSYLKSLRELSSSLDDQLTLIKFALDEDNLRLITRFSDKRNLLNKEKSKQLYRHLVSVDKPSKQTDATNSESQLQNGTSNFKVRKSTMIYVKKELSTLKSQIDQKPFLDLRYNIITNKSLPHVEQNQIIKSIDNELNKIKSVERQIDELVHDLKLSIESDESPKKKTPNLTKNNVKQEIEIGNSNELCLRKRLEHIGEVLKTELTNIQAVLTENEEKPEKTNSKVDLPTENKKSIEACKKGQKKSRTANKIEGKRSIFEKFRRKFSK